jgi:hypothetical protein
MPHVWNLASPVIRGLQEAYAASFPVRAGPQFGEGRGECGAPV